jgi:hemerythrin-like domain-containing protein
VPVVIGAKPESGFQDPIGLLMDCHRRIEMFLGVLLRVSDEARGGSLSAVQRESVRNALRYFREAAPKHTADEEESLFPRVRAKDGHDSDAMLQRIEALEREHVIASASHEEVDQLGEQWLKDGTLPPATAARLHELLAGLAAAYRSHIEAEDREIFPWAASLLSAPDRNAIGREMAARRGLAPD